MSAHAILVVEDNPITRKMIRYALETEGFGVLDAEDGRSAFAAVATRTPDLLIVDYVLPDIDGLKLVADVRRQSNRPELPAIVVTGMVSRLDDLRTQAGAFSHFLGKPVEPSRLLDVVRAQLSAPGPAATGCRVLVVDDELSNRKLALFRLKQSGYEVELASAGREALELARHRPPDAIVSDVMMPGMDGFTFCREARRDPRLATIPIVLVSSAYVDAADQDLARKMGANALVLRTPDMADVTAALARGLRGFAPPPVALRDEALASLHRERLQVQLERQTAHNETLLRQAAIQATALSIIRGLSNVLAQPKDATQILGDVLVHCLDAAGLSTGLLYVIEPDGRHRLQANFGLPATAKAHAEECFGHPELLRRIVDERQPVALVERVSDTEPATHDFLTQLGHHSALVVPFVVLGETFGELVLASDTQDLSESAWIAFARNIGLQFGQTVALGQSMRRLAESEERYRTLTEHANDAIAVLSPGGHIVEVNEQMERLLAQPREVVTGRHVADFATPPGSEQPRPGSLRLIQEAMDAGGGLAPNIVFRTQDARLVEFDFWVSSREIGGHRHFLCIGRDVTERNRSAAALREAQDRLRHVLSSSPAVLFSLHPVGEAFRPTWVSENVRRLLGASPEDVLEPEWARERIHPDDRDRVMSEVAAIFERGHVDHEYRLRNENGEYRWLHAELRLLRDENARPVEAIGSWADVTARKEAELRVMESEEQYRMLFDSNPHPMWVYDRETFRILAVNGAALRHYGYSRGEWLAMSALDVHVPGGEPGRHDGYSSLLKRADARGDPASPTFKHRKKDGTLIEVEVATSGTAFAGRDVGLLLATDVTEKRSLEAQLAQAQKMESIGRLAGGVAHDFNNLLGVITGYGELLSKRVQADDRLRRYSDDILKAARRAADLTRQLLAFSRKQLLQPKILDLNAIVSETETLLRRLIGEDVRLETRLDPHLATVKADPGQMQQVLMNLAVNARDAMPHGGRITIETANVELTATHARQHPGAATGPHVMLAVGDTGHGMSADVAARIFEPFFTTKEAGKGTGLGLATVHGIVKQSGGHITLHSVPGEGTTFSVYIPRTEELQDVEPAALEADLPRGTETVLLVEDEGALRELVREHLEAWGYMVLTARDGAEALAICESHRGPIDLLLTDLVMPRMSGRELATRAVLLKTGIKTLYMSGYTDDAVVLHGLTEKTPFLQKPFTDVALARKVRELLDSEGR
jgi:PAS domain S-box-containing protein